MADDSDHYAPDQTKHFAELYAWKLYFVATYAMLVWDWLICLDMEVERIWMRQRNSFTGLWVLLRYLPILMFLNATYTMFQTTWEPEVCNKFAVAPTAFIISLMIIAHIIFLLRTYALYQRSKLILRVFVPAIVIEAGVLIWTAFDERITVLPKGFGCIPGSPRRVQGVVTWTAPFVYDCMVFGFTLYKSLEYMKEHNDMPIVQVILRDGLVYFGVMSLSYSLNIFMFIFAPIGLQDMNAGFSAAITVLSTCRLILNLRAVTGRGTSQVQSMRSRMSFLSKPSELASTFLSEIGGGLEVEMEQRARARQEQHEFPLRDLRDSNEQPPVRGGPYVV
ncbi:hypothetical protein AURDEDRAFT_183623 [Auricularia subglabra TFB-10046 SS5]|nr:hypothetical protein AURDEDRAFT_183623 [Auricularia subglabra TFB-10046 SS5]